MGPERKGPYVTFCQIEKIGFKVQNSRKNNFSYKKKLFLCLFVKLLPIKADFFRLKLCSVNVESFIIRFCHIRPFSLYFKLIYFVENALGHQIELNAH